MVSNGEVDSNIDKLVSVIDTIDPRAAVRQLVLLVQLQQERIRQLEKEIFDRCMDLRQRVAVVEQR